MKKLIMDLDGTLTLGDSSEYSLVSPNLEVVEQLREYKNQGFEIIISTARNMRTYDGNLGKINVNTLPIIIEWLKKHKIPYDEIYVGKPWCGTEGFYVDDKAIRPDEFVKYNYEKIKKIVGIK